MALLFVAGAFDLTENAPAKINLALHVTGRRDDGYHLVDMLVTFASECDRLGFGPSFTDEFSLSGRFVDCLASEAADGSNLVTKARDMLRQAALAAGHEAPAVHIHLEKNLPIASGIGGGSADAAAALRGLSRLWKLNLPRETVEAIALGLGADVPMCLAGEPLIARGIGEKLQPLPLFPSLPLVLGNPLVAVSTPEVFRRLENRNNPAFGFAATASHGLREWMNIVADLRNDLEPPARSLCPQIAELDELMRQAGASLVRMSGSGATCFGLFDNLPAADAAADKLHRQRPDWYFRATETVQGRT
jgi:4-diphosphocytidyl-2-C-methyl-D-erythritol kinase